MDLDSSNPSFIQDDTGRNVQESESLDDFYTNQDEEESSGIITAIDDDFHLNKSRLSELEPLTPQKVGGKADPIKVFTGSPLIEYVPQRKSKGSSLQTLSKGSSFSNARSTTTTPMTPSVLITLNDVNVESQQSKRSKMSVSFQSPTPRKVGSLLYKTDNSNVDSVDSESGTPMNYFPSKYRMGRPQGSLEIKTQRAPIVSSPSLLSGTSPDNQSLGTAYSSFSQMSTDSSRNSSVMSYRSSTSKSILFGEVINLEETRRLHLQHHQKQGGSRLYGNVITQDSYGGDIEQQRSGSDFVGMEIGGSRHSRSLRHLEEASYHRPQENEQHLPNGLSPAYYFLKMLKGAKTLGQTNQDEIKKIGAKVMARGQQMLHYYRPPLSPRTKALMDLEFLQKAHKEKVGQLVEGDGLEEHWDFVLVLTPQEAYRFWSSLLDFRVEHIGFEALTDMESSLKTNSTDESNNTVSTDSPEDYRKHEQDVFSTPNVGIKRRKGGSTPPSNNKNHLLLRSAAKSMFTTADATEMTGYSHVTQGRVRQRLSMFEKALLTQAPPENNREASLGDESSIQNNDIRQPEPSTVRRRWGNHAQGTTSAKNLLSPPVRSLTRGGSSIRKVRVDTSRTAVKPMETFSEEEEDRENVNPNVILNEEDIPNPVIPRGIAARTNGLLRFLSVLQRGIVLRRHRPNKEALYCKIFSNDGGDTIHYHLIDPEEAMVAFKEQRVRYNRTLTHSSSPTSVRAVSREWACLDGPGEGSAEHKFKVPDHIAAQRYREKLSREHAFSKRLMELANKAANSGMIKAADVVAVHPASHLDPRHPGVRRGELGTASLRKSRSEYHTPHAFSIATAVRQKFPSTGNNSQNNRSDNKWYSGEGSDLQFKILDFEAATEGEYWLIFRGFLLLHRDATVGRFASERKAGIGGGTRKRDQREGQECDYENMLHRDEFTEPATAGCIEKLVVKLRKMDMTYIEGDMAAGAAPPPSDYFLGFKSPGTQVCIVSDIMIKLIRLTLIRLILSLLF
jgi:hypothetical protein